MISLNKKSKKLLLLQRNELLTKNQIFLRKKFGRFLFTNFLINYFEDKNLKKMLLIYLIKNLIHFKIFYKQSRKYIRYWMWIRNY